jgi:hypothetical protein
MGVIMMILPSKGPNKGCLPYRHPHLITGKDPVSETLRFLVISNSGRWTKSTNLVILGVLQHC